MTTGPRLRMTLLSLSVLCIGLATSTLRAQDDNKPKTAEIKLPTIADEPKTVDPATLVPKFLAAPVTVEFTETSLRELGKWIEEQQKIPVLFDTAALSDEGIPLGEPVTDRLKNAPLYLLLNRLRSLGLAWYVEDRILHITTQLAASERMATEPYNAADLLDAGYKPDDLSDAIMAATSGSWQEIDGEGGDLQWLGDVQFIRQTSQVQREIVGLLTALRKHGRQTFIIDPPQHLLLRQKLEQNIDVKFQDVPLFRAVEQLAEKSGADIRLDLPSLRKIRVRDREPVSLALTDRKLSTVLQVLMNDLGLTWILRDGVLWITSKQQADNFQKTAIYDVRDLCSNSDESDALTNAISSQTSGPWMEIDGEGGNIAFVKDGTMVVRQTERGLREVFALLETYRKALRASKPRDRDAVDPQEVVSRYYRMDAGIAQDLEKLLPQLVTPESWKSDQKPAAAGTILRVSSGPKLLAAGKAAVTPGSGAAKSQANSLVVSMSVLIVRQTRGNHDEIIRIIGLVERGDPLEVKGLGQGLGGVGGAGGGFGGGYFSIPQRPLRK